MDTTTARRIYHNYSNAVGYVDVEATNGDRAIGTCFHIGEGVFVTARHVVENNTVLEIRIAEPVGVRASEAFPEIERTEEWDQALKERLGFVPHYKHWLPPLQIVEGPYFSTDSRVDLAIFRVRSTRLHQS